MASRTAADMTGGRRQPGTLPDDDLETEVREVVEAVLPVAVAAAVVVATGNSHWAGAVAAAVAVPFLVSRWTAAVSGDSD